MGIHRFIKKIFAWAPAPMPEPLPVADPGTFYFHEDFHCQLEFLPKENFKTASKTAGEILEHADKNFDGNGWWGCYVRSEAGVPTKNKKYNVAEFAGLLQQHGFSAYIKVTSGYSSTVFPCNNTRAFKNNSMTICIDVEDDHVINVWQAHPPLATDNELYKTLLLALAARYEFLLADWWRSIIVDIANPSGIDRYLAYEEG